MILDKALVHFDDRAKAWLHGATAYAVVFTFVVAAWIAAAPIIDGRLSKTAAINDARTQIHELNERIARLSADNQSRRVVLTTRAPGALAATDAIAAREAVTTDARRLAAAAADGGAGLRAASISEVVERRDAENNEWLDLMVSAQCPWSACVTFLNQAARSSTSIIKSMRVAPTADDDAAVQFQIVLSLTAQPSDTPDPEADNGP